MKDHTYVTDQAGKLVASFVDRSKANEFIEWRGRQGETLLEADFDQVRDQIKSPELAD